MLSIKVLGPGCANCRKLEEIAREAFRLASAKLPFATTFVTRQVGQ